MLRREGWRDNHKRMYQHSSEQWLSLHFNVRIGINWHCGDSPCLWECICFGISVDVILFTDKLGSYFYIDITKY